MYGHPLATHSQADAYAPDGELMCLSLQFQQDAGLQEWIVLIPAGLTAGRDGRSVLNDDPDQVVQAFKERAVSIPFDIEHASQIKAVKGEPAPAQGWIEDLEVREGAVWARVDWTDGGRELIKSKQYRYYSPALVMHKATGGVARLVGAGLTNQPNLFLPALHSQAGNLTEIQEDNDMNLLAILAALDLANDATEKDAVAAIHAMKKDASTALHRAEHPDIAQFIPVATHSAMQARAETAESALAEQKASLHKEAVETVIAKAVTDGKIAPADKGYYQAQCHTEEGLAQFQQFVEKTPGVMPGQGDAGEKKKEAGEVSLNAEEQHVATLMGVPHEEFAKSKTEQAVG